MGSVQHRPEYRRTSQSMTLERINPEDLPSPLGYTHVIVATGSRLVFVAGQEPEDEQGHLVGPGDLAVQARQVFANLGRALAAAGARPEQVPKITIFVVHYRREYLPAIEEGRVALLGITSRPTHSWEWRHCPDPNT
jgi:enamine deaminase RidA (YjgF/YER057c/UK114 family)